MEMWSPYASNYDNPIRYNDFLGDQPGGPGDRNRRDGINTGPGDADYYYREDNNGAIVSSSSQDYAQNPVKAAVNDAVYLVASVTGFNSLDNYIYNRVAGQNSPKQVVTETVHLGLSLSGGKNGKPGEVPTERPGEVAMTEKSSVTAPVAAPTEATAAAPGAQRAAQYSAGWANGSLKEAIDQFAPGAEGTASGQKTIYTNSTTGVQVVADNAGNYFRVQNTNLPGRRTYLDLNGNVPNNKVVNGKQTGRSQAEYNQATHFNNTDK